MNQQKFRELVKSSPVGPIAWRAHRYIRRRWFPIKDSTKFWQDLYAHGGNSGPGSYGEHATTKAAFLNDFIKEHGISSAVEFGCGDGNQLALVDYPRYLGLDVSPQAIKHCMARFAHDDTKSFMHYDPALFADPAGWVAADLAVSLDVVFHLLEDDVYDRYMRQLFAAGRRFVVMYASDEDRVDHDFSVRHRPITSWVRTHAPDWEVGYVQAEPTEGQFARFHVFTQSSALMRQS